MSSTKYLKGECQQCRGHIEFAPEAVGTTTECPHCGQTTELLLALPPTESLLPTKAIVYTIIAIVILVGGLIGTQIALNRTKQLVEQQNAAASSAPPKPATPPAPRDSKLTNAFRVSTIKLEKMPGTSVVHAVGTVRNESNRRRFGVRVQLDLFDSAGARVGAATDYCPQVLEPKTEWSFAATILMSGATSAKLASITEDQ